MFHNFEGFIHSRWILVSCSQTKPIQEGSGDMALLRSFKYQEVLVLGTSKTKLVTSLTITRALKWSVLPVYIYSSDVST